MTEGKGNGETLSGEERNGGTEGNCGEGDLPQTTTMGSYQQQKLPDSVSQTYFTPLFTLYHLHHYFNIGPDLYYFKFNAWHVWHMLPPQHAHNTRTLLLSVMRKWC